MNVLMVGVDESTKGGMWTVVENYLNDNDFMKKYNLLYIPTSITGCSILKKILFTFKAYYKIINAYHKTNFHIIHVHMSERTSIIRKSIVMKYAKKKGSKIVLHMHGAEFEMLYKDMKDSKKIFVRNTLELADKIIILGEYWKTFIGGLISDPSKICVVYNAVSVPKTYKYNKSSKNILFLGAVSKRKGINILLEALKEKAAVLEKSCHVNIYGPNVEGNIVEQIREKGLSNWVKYNGWLDKENKSKILSNASINILPSYNEGLPMTILEAMSYGIPSITTAVAAIPEAVNDKNGIVITPGDINALAMAIQNLFFDKEKRIRLSKQAYIDAINKFSVERHIAQISEIYDELS